MSIPRPPVTGATEVAVAPAVPAAVGARKVQATGESAANLDVEALIKRAAQAHAALMQGDLNRYRAAITIAADFTLMSPFGGTPTRGADLSEERWASIARFFRHGRDSSLELIQAYSVADMVVVAAIERTHAEVGGLAGQQWSLRVTLVFRKDGEEWRLVHRHADPLVAGISVEASAALAASRARSISVPR